MASTTTHPIVAAEPRESSEIETVPEAVAPAGFVAALAVHRRTITPALAHRGTSARGVRMLVSWRAAAR